MLNEVGAGGWGGGPSGELRIKVVWVGGGLWSGFLCPSELWGEVLWDQLGPRARVLVGADGRLPGAAPS